MCGLLMKIKWCAWAAVFCSMTSYGNSRSPEDARQGKNLKMIEVRFFLNVNTLANGLFGGRIPNIFYNYDIF